MGKKKVSFYQLINGEDWKLDENTYLFKDYPDKEKLFKRIKDLIEWCIDYYTKKDKEFTIPDHKLYGCIDSEYRGVIITKEELEPMLKQFKQ